MTPRYGAVVAGHICLDLFPELTAGIPPAGGLAEAGRLRMRLGGCVANTGLALAALGGSVELVASVGDDLLGEAAASLLTSAPPTVRTSLTRIPGRSTSYSIVIEAPGEDRRFLHHVGANEFFDGGDVPVGGARLLHVGYPQLLPRLLDADGMGLTGLLGRARAAGVTTSVDFATVDPNSRPRPWPAILRRWAPLVDVLTPSLDDLIPAFAPVPAAGAADEPVRHARELAEALVDAGVGVALVTAGRAGMCLRTAHTTRLRAGGEVLAGLPEQWADRQLWVPSRAVEPVQTTGAGDTATAGILYGLLAGLDPPRTLRLAAAAAALHVSGVVPIPPWAGDSVYDDHPPATQGVETHVADGWTADPSSGLLYGPADQKGVT